MATRHGTGPTFVEEQALQRQGLRLVAGIDEAGRGPLAGPVVAAAVILPDRWLARARVQRRRRASTIRGRTPQPEAMLNDSKLLTRRQREILFDVITSTAIAYGVGLVAPGHIDAMGIVPSTRLAMRRAIQALAHNPDALLVDAIELADEGLPCKAIVHGDALCGSIAAASVVAKVSRDRLMEEMDRRYPGYGFARHKGYGTREHLQRLRELGPCVIHRRSFAPVRDLLARPRLL
ncbi:MAG: ribonuclease HII [Chloroflexi bacterium]|nr:ribonuclease HII [Chloroflexota bacterium]MCH8283152.1 ribonuclease HII [Chloroflexota bacterium]